MVKKKLSLMLLGISVRYVDIPNTEDICFCGHSRKFHVETYECCGGECDRAGGTTVCIKCPEEYKNENHEFVFDNFKYVEHHAKR
mgnify:CR=1 FL=1